MKHLTLLLFLVAVTLTAQDRFANVQIKAEKLTDQLYMLTGAGGNLGLSVGPDAIFLVDDQYAPLTDKIKAAIAEIQEGPVKFVMNTHYHGDHTGGNENFGKAGSIIVAHENVRERLSTTQVSKLFGRETPPSPKAALPVVTFTRDITFHLNDETIDIFHVANAHTDGDGIVHFKNQNVVHMGDTFFNGFYPYIDTEHGGSVDGLIKAIDRILAMIDDDTKIIPGHGPLATKKDLQTYRDVLAGVRAAIQKHVDAGDSEEATLAAKPTAPWDETWGKGFMRPDVFTKIVYGSLKGE